MREIKFRFAFKKENKIYFSFYSIDEICEIHIKAEIEAMDAKGYDLISKDQYTGLTDRSGKEIYEGDILSHRFYNQPVMVTFERCCFIAEDVSITHCSLEVIGNVCENPELLTGPTK